MSGLVQPEYECWAKGSWQVFLFPFGVATLATYSFAVPAVALWFLQKNKELVKTDQILRAKDTGDDTLTNPRAYQFRCVSSRPLVSLLHPFRYRHQTRPLAAVPPAAHLQPGFLQALLPLPARQVVLGVLHHRTQDFHRREYCRPSCAVLACWQQLSKGGRVVGARGDS